ncbi:MAG: hypothetical protein OEW98_06940 [Betaproteobacteria bacterium]|nr:hypothetical protein [Betaproteobacteria bacterium]
MAVVALGVIAIVGSGPDISILGPPVYDPPSDPTLSVRVLPERQTVQAGTIVDFYAVVNQAVQPLAYQWRRNGVDITGATGPTYTLGGAQLGDDGALFEVAVKDSLGVSGIAGTTLLVSPWPAVVLQDGDFPVSNWTVSATAQPTQDGPTHAETQATDGGNPGPYRSVTFQLTPGPCSLRLVHLAVAATYDPAAQGAIHAMEFSEECSRRSFSSAATFTDLNQAPVFEQAGRTYQPRNWQGYPCQSGGSIAWTATSIGTVTEDEFVFSGPPCGASERCPDFSASAAPLRFGFVTTLGLAAGSPAGLVVQGIDNWRVTVWKK